ncbi:MAG TPA: TIGR02281 family clan AA aspartic protease [Caulobacteraceae bacterium]|jgi:aspartyl protease family protein
MFRYAAFAVVGALLALGALQVGTGSAAHAAADAPLRGPQGSDIESAARLAKAPDGHFWADAMVDGHAVHVLVDTGASSVFLTPRDAERLGLYTGGLVFDRTVHTAGGDSLAARVKLRSVSVGSVRVANVEALVIGRGLPTSLLGMSYLGRLSRFEATPSTLVLNP